MIKKIPCCLFIYNHCSLLNQNDFSEADNSASSFYSLPFSLETGSFYGNKTKQMKPRVFVIVIIILLPYLQISQKPFKWKELFHCSHSMKLTGDSNTVLIYRCINVRVSVYTQTCT